MVEDNISTWRSLTARLLPSQTLLVPLSLVANLIRGDGELLTVSNLAILWETTLLICIASIVPYRAFKTADGDVLFGGGNDRLFRVMCEKLEVPNLPNDSRFESNNVRVKNRDVLERIIEDITKTRTTQEWLRIFEGSGVPYSAINDIQTTLHHDHGKWYSVRRRLILTDTTI